MPRFFLPGEKQIGQTVVLTGEDAHHVARSLRIAVGDTLALSDCEAFSYECRVTAVRDDKEVELCILEKTPLCGEPPYTVTLHQALAKGEKMDVIIQKAVESGVHRIVPFESENCVMRVRDESESRKKERRMRIASDAARQSRRGVIPTVEDTCSFEEALQLAQSDDLALFCYEDSRADSDSLRRVLHDFRANHPACTHPRISLFIGSEGGFSPKEADAAKKAGCIPVSLGSRILRTETAAPFALACLVYEFEMSE